MNSPILRKYLRDARKEIFKHVTGHRLALLHEWAILSTAYLLNASRAGYRSDELNDLVLKSFKQPADVSVFVREKPPEQMLIACEIRHNNILCLLFFPPVKPSFVTLSLLYQSLIHLIMIILLL